MPVIERQHCESCKATVFVWRGKMYVTREAAEAVRADELKRRQDFRWMRKHLRRAG